MELLKVRKDICGGAKARVNVSNVKWNLFERWLGCVHADKDGLR